MVAASPADLVGQADVVVVAVVNDEQVHAVLSGPDGGLAAAGSGHHRHRGQHHLGVRVCGPSAPRPPPCGVPVLDCGVTGGPAAAASGDLVCMVGGDPAVIDRAGPVFDAISSLTVTMGPFGTGLAAKLARNLITYGSWLAAYEGQQLAEAAGIPLAQLAEVVKASDVHIGGASRLMFRSTVAPFTDADDRGLVGAMQAGADLAHKDLGPPSSWPTSLDVDLPLAAMTEQRADEIFGVGGSPS